MSDIAAPPEALEVYTALFGKFKTGFPDWEVGMLTPEQSVQMMLDVIAKVQPKDTGKFLSRLGTEAIVL